MHPSVDLWRNTVKLLERVASAFRWNHGPADLRPRVTTDCDIEPFAVVMLSWIEWVWLADYDGDGKKDLTASSEHLGKFWA